MNLSQSDLKLSWCSYEAAKYAVLNWHYSKRMPHSKLSRIGVWESGKFVGVVIYGVGAGNSTSGGRYGLSKQFDIAELVRVALCTHKTPTSKIVAISIRMIKKANPKLKLLISFADSGQGHIGTIYQASGWKYAGLMKSENSNYLINGIKVPCRTLYDRYGPGGQSIPWLRAHIDPKAERLKEPPKYRYLYPLCDEANKKIQPFILPHPKRASSSKLEQSPHQAGEGGAVPTDALQFQESNAKEI